MKLIALVLMVYTLKIFISVLFNSPLYSIHHKLFYQNKYIRYFICHGGTAKAANKIPINPKIA